MSRYDALLASSAAPEWLSVLEAPDDLCGAGWEGWLDGLPDVIPPWLLDRPVLDEPVGCACCVEDLGSVAPRPEAEWAAPGVTGLGPVAAGPLPPPSPSVAALLRAVEVATAVRPSQVDAAQALSDAQALLQVEQQLRVHDLARIADVAARGLIELAGARSVKAWLREHRPDGDLGDALLASRLKGFPVLQQAVQDQVVTLAAARRTVTALRRCAPHLDRADGLIDGLPGDLVLNAVIGNTAGLVCRELQGLHDDDPRLQVILDRAQRLLALEGSQVARLEHALVWLAEAIAPRALAGALDEIVVAVLPSLLEERDRKGRERRGLSLTELPDGDGWHLCGDLTLECGERLWTVLRAAVAHDSANPDDTQAWADARAAGADGSDDVWGPLGQKLNNDGVLPKGLPRGRRKRLHDAFSNVLERYLAAGIGRAGQQEPRPDQRHPPRGDSHRPQTRRATTPSRQRPAHPEIAGPQVVVRQHRHRNRPQPRRQSPPDRPRPTDPERRRTPGPRPRRRRPVRRRRLLPRPARPPDRPTPAPRPRVRRRPDHQHRADPERLRHPPPRPPHRKAHRAAPRRQVARRARLPHPHWTTPTWTTPTWTTPTWQDENPLF